MILKVNGGIECGSGHGQVMDFREAGDEPSSSMKRDEQVQLFQG